MEDNLGNTMGNLAGRGLVAGDAFEAFIALSEVLLRISEGNAELIYEGCCSHINYRESMLYFVDNRNRIIAMDMEEGMPYVLAERTGIRYDQINHMIVCGDYLYYSVYWGGAVYRIDLETGMEDFLFFSNCLSLAIDDEYLYYSDETASVIQRMSLNDIDDILSLSRMKLAELWFEQHELSQKDMPDFIRKGMADKIDLSLLLEPEILTEYDGCYSIQFVKGLVLFLTSFEDDEEEGGALHALNPDTGEAMVLLEESVDSFNIIDEFILIKKADDHCLYRMDFDGDIKRIMGDEIEWIYTVGDKILCTCPGGRKLIQLDIDGKKKDIIKIED